MIVLALFTIFYSLYDFVDSVLNEYSKETIAFDSKGYALNLDEYQLKVEEGFEDIKNNKTFSNDEMASKIQQLKRK